jgi:phosphate starvation-inducible PhoH-like protein
MAKNKSGWHPPDNFQQLTSNHLRVIKAINTMPITIVNGPPGSLKTFLGVKTLMQQVKDGKLDKFLYARQNIQRPNEKGLGYRPGSEDEKLSPLLKPIEDNLNAIMPPGELDYELRSKRIEGSDMEMLRGRSPLYTGILVDECQNIDFEGLKCAMTRLSQTSRMVLCGDFKGQRDMHSPDFDAFELVCEEFAGKDGFAVINLNYGDILRNPMIEHIVKGFERIEARRGR